MRCFSCDNLSIKPVCDDCIKDFLTPEMIKKEVGNLEVISFFDYYLTVEFIKSKYTTSGYRVYKFLAQKFIAPFIRAYLEGIKSTPLYLIGVDEDISRGYSNVAQMVHFGSLKSDVKALHNVLRAKNRVKYAGESLEFRLNNPRNFIYKGPKGIDAILIDDTVTTGTTLEQAHRVLKESGVNVHFALTLANAKEGMDY
ncbi:MAG TPA: ComF family protein [Nitratifractor sp.]|nr:ComF family protein [Nitratifractor sp.]HHD75066.1 ComF family protein [Nitratifractor sp.]